MPFCAVNLLGTGERYAYSHFLCTQLIFSEAQPRFLHQDLACKHQPWRAKVEARVQSCSPELQATAACQRTLASAAKAELVTDVLPEAHGLLHAWQCQV